MTEEQKAQYEKLKAQVNVKELLEKVRLGHCLMEWENARYMELPMEVRKKVEEESLQRFKH
jgi:hypothetical protein